MFSTIYIGGGTPSLLSPKQIETLLSGIKNCLPRWNNPSEITMEMNPQSLDEEKLSAAFDNGVNRLSVGIQSLTEKSLDSVHRSCSSKSALNALDLIKQKWKGELNLDCMAGLPYQTSTEFCSSLERIIDFDPNHISLYTLTIEDDTPLARNIENGFVFDFDEADNQWLLGRDILEKNGFHQYEISNFSKTGFESKHNMSYWKQKNYIGAGSGATGTIYNFDAKEKGFRWTNQRDIKKYIDFWTRDFQNEAEIPRDIEFLDQETQEFEYLMMGLRTLEGLNPEEYMERFGHLDWKGNLGFRLGTENGPWKKFSDQNLCQSFEETKRYALNQNGILFLNKLLENYL